MSPGDLVFLVSLGVLFVALDLRSMTKKDVPGSIEKTRPRKT